MSNHTPGPWDISKRNDPVAPFSIISGAASGRAYAICICPRFRGEDWADDAKLIAAAPDLYHACELAITTLIVNCQPAGNADVDDKAEIQFAVKALRYAISKVRPIIAIDSD